MLIDDLKPLPAGYQFPEGMPQEDATLDGKVFEIVPVSQETYDALWSSVVLIKRTMMTLPAMHAGGWKGFIVDDKFIACDPSLKGIR